MSAGQNLILPFIRVNPRLSVANAFSGWRIYPRPFAFGRLFAAATYLRLRLWFAARSLITVK
jgi:hypothetical protein